MSLEPTMTLAALVVEACIGYPQLLAACIGHPVQWIGRAIDALDRAWNKPTRGERTRLLLGVFTVTSVVTLTIAVSSTLTFIAGESLLGGVVVVLVATAGLAQHSLFLHVRDVLLALDAGRLTAARAAVSRIVGRDTASLDADAVAAAALESLAESFNDAVVAPAFWLLAAGLPGLFAYKAINTADSMIGHLEPRWRSFGWAAARLDDLVNLAPARIAGCLLAAAAPGGFRIMWRDARKHASPNAGWPEAALAGGLAIQLGGPACYDGVVSERAVLGAGHLPTTDDLRRGLRIYLRACLLLWLVVLAVALTMGIH